MPEPPPTPLPEHVTMPLLTLVTRNSLDQDYAYVAARRAGSPSSPPNRRTVIALMVVLAGFGALVSTAAAQRTREAAVDETSRDSLVAQVEAQRTELSSLQDRIGTLQTSTTDAQQRLAEVEDEVTPALARLRRLQARTGYGEMAGAGVRITVDDSPSGSESGAVRDTDLALLVDALWGVGAEGIAINDQRLTALSAIRNANVAIHVNGRPLAPPYVVEAIGDPRTLQANLVNSERGQRFFALASGLGLQVDMTNQDDLDLPSATHPTLRYAAAGSDVENKRDKEDAP